MYFQTNNYRSFEIWCNLQDPIRKIPGPPGLPILGNVLSLNPSFLHIQLFEMARKYGAVMKLKIFTYPIVVINSKDACLEALIKAGETQFFTFSEQFCRVEHGSHA